MFKKYGDITSIKIYKFGSKSKTIRCEECNNIIVIFDSKFACVNNNLMVPKENINGLKVKCLNCNKTNLIKI